jgi:CubicO group peptidase (beta-lactamase class C family)
MKRHLLLLLAACLVILAYSACSHTEGTSPDAAGKALSSEKIETTAASESESSDGWKTSTPEAQGMDSQKLYGMIKYIQGLGIDSLLIARNGFIVTEAYFYSNTKSSVHDLRSCTKSVTSALVGIAIEEGYIKGVDSKILDLFAQYKFENMDENKKNIALKHLLTMSAGFEWNEDYSLPNEKNPAYQISSSPDSIRFLLNRKLVEEPGKVFHYNSGQSDLLSSILTKATGMDTFTYAEKKLFQPLGITEKYWGTFSDGTVCGAAGLNMCTRDMAKFGTLYLNKGKWNGRQIVPEKWVEDSTKKQIDADFNGTAGGYGYQWWLNRFGGYSARGIYGQYIFVMPELKMVVVFQSHFSNNDLPPYYLMEGSIIPAAVSQAPLPENKEAYQQLLSVCSNP